MEEEIKKQILSPKCAFSLGYNLDGEEIQDIQIMNNILIVLAFGQCDRRRSQWQWFLIFRGLSNNFTSKVFLSADKTSEDQRHVDPNAKLFCSPSQDFVVISHFSDFFAYSLDGVRLFFLKHGLSSIRASEMTLVRYVT